MNSSLPHQAASVIKARIGNFRPRLGIGLGTGSAGVAKEIEPVMTIPYADLPGFEKTHVEGHPSEMVIGYFHGLPVACLKGRVHFYSGYSNEAILTPIRTLREIGCDTLCLTNASGSLNPGMKPGDIVMIKDHINLQFRNPLVGPNDDYFGTRFPDMSEAYHGGLRKKMHSIATKLHIKLLEGVYLGVLGPCYETPAEIRTFQSWGVDLVGMSTVPETIIANHCGMRVLALSIPTNIAAGLSEEILKHEEAIRMGEKASGDLARLMAEFARTYDEFWSE